MIVFADTSVNLALVGHENLLDAMVGHDLLAKARFRASDDLIREALRLAGE